MTGSGPEPRDPRVHEPGEIWFDDHLLGDPPPRRRGQRGHTRLGLNLTAMIDVVFLLLVYFMVATEFKAGEEVFRMDLPDRQQSQREKDPFDLDDEPLRVHVASSGPRRDAYQIRLEGPYDQPDTFSALHEFLRQRQIGPDATLGLFEPDHPIIIVPARSARWEHAIETLNAAARARYTNLSFAKPN